MNSSGNAAVEAMLGHGDLRGVIDGPDAASALQERVAMDAALDPLLGEVEVGPAHMFHPDWRDDVAQQHL